MILQNYVLTDNTKISDMTTELEKEVLSKFKLPLKLDDMGIYIFDQDNQMVADVCAWGKLQYYHNGVKLQMTLGEMIVKSFNEKYSDVNKG